MKYFIFRNQTVEPFFGEHGIGYSGYDDISFVPDNADRLIAEAAKRIADKVDMFVLAQGSMARMEQRLSELTGKPVLSSPVLGVKGLRKFLGIDKR